MARFPETEPEIAALANLLALGLVEMTEDFPAPPVAADELQGRLDAYQAAAKTTVDAEFALREQHAVKDRALESLVDGMKMDLKYAEAAAREQPEKLSKLGWGPRRGANSLEAPGEVRNARIVSEGDNWVILELKTSRLLAVQAEGDGTRVIPEIEAVTRLCDVVDGWLLVNTL